MQNTLQCLHAAEYDLRMSSKLIPPPRLCHMLKCPTTGYGFSLTSHPGRPGRYVGSVEEGSAAEAAGLVEGDRVVEVNGVNVNQENHKQVINRIKLVDHETKLLVVDKVCDQYHAERDIVLKSSLPYVVLLSSSSNTSFLSIEQETDKCRGEVFPCKKMDSFQSPDRDTKSSSHNLSSLNEELDLPMTAKEMKEKLERKRKKDPRREDKGDIRRRFEMIQEL